MLALPDRVSIVEVGPRDGLQSLPTTFPTDVKVALVELLAQTGLRKIEVTAMARPDIVPQLADAEDVLRRIERRPEVVYRVLCPNRRGAERAVGAGADEIVGLITGSETYNRKNSNMSIAENLAQVAQMRAVAGDAGVHMVMAIGVCTFCPYEGELPESRLLDLISRMHADGISEFCLATSAGVDGPRTVHRTLSLVRERWPDLALGLHLHNTNGMALANALAAVDAGATAFEGSICGIGGGIRMPQGMAHHGNVATDDLVHLFSEMGVETGVDLARLLAAGRQARDLLGLEATFSHALLGGTKEVVLRQGRIAPHGR
jgi:hydroxymethylglutaryl-CoA lyase